ncbi:Fe2+-dependent dioxygenase [Sphingorhabdus sp. Alg239-R122]|uniref:Fe2+-dependent dioxygenase n=1 Tax=Sphingorhabdus sp. Alg239-R122 TaxID=2305989 RepID=UPI0013DC7C9E|nr:Fe2+-dependent dioxygenase [Sphingorhabdus sp. Alg239-R122]
MIKQIPHLLSADQVREIKSFCEKADFVDGRISNPHSKVKNNLHLGDMDIYEKTSQLMMDALAASEDFQNFALPHNIAPPLITRYEIGMHYGLHPDSAVIPLPQGPLRSDLSCTIFLNDPNSYEGGALRITLGDSAMRFKGAAGSAIVYPSNTLHEVEAVVSGQRLVAISFIQSRIADNARRHLLYELSEVAALEGLGMSDENHNRLQSVKYNLSRMWMDV